VHPKFRTPYKNTMLVGLLAAIVGSVTPIDDIGKMVNIGTLLAFVIVCIAVMILRQTNPDQARPFRTPWVSGCADSRHPLQRLHDVQTGWVNWARLFIWLAIGMVIYFTYSRHQPRQQLPTTVRPACCGPGWRRGGLPSDYQTLTLHSLRPIQVEYCFC